ncbi:hypothetical protein AGMMS50284_5110 [Clostridia bacterium]|nr:hypothetical protein AGMMS50284_5110 [Clostridia bacterium]
MPYISAVVNVQISAEKEEIIKTKLGKAVTLIPGKSESRLMLSFTENNALYFAGEKNKPIAFVEVKLFGSATKEAYNNLTAEISKILNDELKIPQRNIYVKYEEVANWGCNGSNF